MIFFVLFALRLTVEKSMKTNQCNNSGLLQQQQSPFSSLQPFKRLVRRRQRLFFMFSTLYSLLTNEPQTTYHSSSRPNHNFAHSAAQQQTAPVNLETVKNATAPSVVTNFAASNTSSSTTVAVVKPTFSAPSPTADNLKIESPATANTTTTTANITNEKAERGISASEVTERSGRNSSPKSLQHHASTTSLNQNNAKHFEGK